MIKDNNRYNEINVAKYYAALFLLRFIRQLLAVSAAAKRKISLGAVKVNKDQSRLALPPSLPL